MLLTMLVLSVAACLFSLQLRKLQKEGEALAAGNLDAQVDTKWMYWDVKRHAENLNSIGDGMAAAIDKQLKSERLKTELITNVSHDIKTPLTSIINYVDLLQHEHTPEQEEEYLAVLKRQAFKLKKLTEDLVEASKATTGNLPVNAVRCSMNELLSQVEGEYGDKLSAADLTLVSVMPDKELFCNVDGALMWRVIDNLLSNICKYAQNGTRVYLTLEKTGGDAVVTFKNTSRAAARAYSSMGASGFQSEKNPSKPARRISRSRSETGRSKPKLSLTQSRLSLMQILPFCEKPILPGFAAVVNPFLSASAEGKPPRPLPLPRFRRAWARSRFVPAPGEGFERSPRKKAARGR